MTEQLEIGSTPYDETCSQLGSDNYAAQSRAECRAFIAQLLRAFGKPPEGCRYRTLSFEHDFGTYHEVGLVFDGDSEACWDYVMRVEGNIPAKWDDIARRDLFDIA